MIGTGLHDLPSTCVGYATNCSAWLLQIIAARYENEHRAYSDVGVVSTSTRMNCITARS